MDGTTFHKAYTQIPLLYINSYVWCPNNNNNNNDINNNK